MQIYIPLCFYFIGFPSVVPMSRGKIYIPLCFYFIVVPYDNLEFDIYIYIPLCFYFIAGEMEDRRLQNAFTFHYASTLSKEMSTGWGAFFKFTFHYASTLSKQIPELPPGILIYIPLCFYFIAKLSALSFYPLTFTFHYASTLSNGGVRIGAGVKHLHSTMLLLYLNPLAFSAETYLNLHSTMLLLYPVSRISTHLKEINLHSTMLLLYLAAVHIATAADIHLHSTMLLLYHVVSVVVIC